MAPELSQKVRRRPAEEGHAMQAYMIDGKQLHMTSLHQQTSTLIITAPFHETVHMVFTALSCTLNIHLSSLRSEGETKTSPWKELAL